MTLIEKLVRTAEIWGRENDRSLARLATIVVNDGKLFERIAAGGSCTVATYERLMAHLGDAANWTSAIPAEAAGLLGISMACCGGVHSAEVCSVSGDGSLRNSPSISHRSAAEANA